VPQFADFDPDTYLALMAEEVAGYEELQERTAAATEPLDVRTILELGVGTGETSRRVLALHPGARLVGIDRQEDMLGRARELLPDADLRIGRLEDPLPQGPFDLVVSALAVHHLDGAGKRDLFTRVAAALRPGGAFVLADVVVPRDPAEATTPLEDGFDLPDTIDDQLAWLREAGLEPELVWERGDLALFRAVLA
jgi:tRNA (cmo5U34)-methyltransferase